MDLQSKISELATTYFPIWVLLVSVVGLVRPGTFSFVLPHISLLLGTIMFGMGMTLTLEDFRRVLQQPRDVMIGVLAQYTVMPLVALGIARAFHLSPELAVGMILVGSCPGGTASNVIAYLARGDVALSVTMTSVSTLISPLMTPLLTLWLAGRWMQVPAVDLFLSILQIVLVPVLLGVAAHRFFSRQVARSIHLLPLVSVAAIVLIVGAIIGLNASLLLSLAPVVLAAVVLHNCLGLLLGYLAASLLGMDRPRRRTVAIEVGMQNSGLAVALATIYFSPAAALPGALFSVWHNISGPILAGWWSRRE
ncbi:MAG: bile acid:sodium symporter family protein [Methanosarcinales archaeon]|nr:bile acid:sodium symporter family protein [Methanosarcinales archaeon]